MDRVGGARAFTFAFLLVVVVTAPVPAAARLPHPPRGRHPPRSGIGDENGRTGATNWLAPDASNHAVEGYTSEISVAPGDVLHLHVSTAPAASYRIAIYRVGWYTGSGARLVACIPSDCVATEEGAPQPLPTPDASTGIVRARWPVTDSVGVGAGWMSGYYVARFLLASGTSTAATFVVRDPPAPYHEILVVAPVNTWQAYNAWGGKSLYDFSSEGRVPANRVSFDRPWGPGSQSQFYAWGIQLVRFLEREGYDLSYTTDVDVDRDPTQLARHALVVVNGHGEYWTSRIRDAFDSALTTRVNLAFIGANIGYWQVRYEDNWRTIVGYKERPDPVTDPRQQTTLFRALTPPRPECALLGVEHQGALRRAGTAAVDYAVNAAALGDRWFRNTGFDAQTVLPDLVGPEWDQVVPPQLASQCTFPNLTVFFHHEGPPGNADAVRYIAPSGARVFSAGSLQFAWGLDTFLTQDRGHTVPADPRLQRFMRNALEDLTSAPLDDPFAPEDVRGIGAQQPSPPMNIAGLAPPNRHGQGITGSNYSSRRAPTPRQLPAHLAEVVKTRVLRGETDGRRFRQETRSKEIAFARTSACAKALEDMSARR